MKVLSFVGGHPVNVIASAVYDASIRKYRGGVKVMEIPYAGKMLSAKVSQTEAEPVVIDGISIPTMTPQVFADVDPIPSADECDFCIVSAMYVAACKSLGIDTSRLLTMGGTVVDDDGRVIGVIGFNRN